MYGRQLEQVTSEKDLGVVFSNDLKVAKQCEEAYSTASRILGLIDRTVRFRTPTVLVSLYKSMVRPHIVFSRLESSLHQGQSFTRKSSASLRENV